MGWDATRYLSFGAARLRPALDLINRIPLDAPARIVDLGCGPGTITRLLCERWPQARVSGVDASPAMLDRARALLPALPWTEADLATWSPASPSDLVFSNAALHWLPDHPGLFKRLRNWVAPGGVLALQMPANFAAPSHRLIRELAARPEFRHALGDARMGEVLEPADYHGLLADSTTELEVWSSEYLQVLNGEQAVLDWLRGTTLVPYLDRLDAEAGAAFLAALAPALAAAYPRRADGTTLFPFRRLFIVARC